MLLPEIAPANLTRGHSPRQWIDLPYHDGQLPDDQAYILLSILLAQNPSQILEIGTFFGHTTLRIALTLPQAIVHTIDLPLDFVAHNPSPLAKTDFHLITARQVGQLFRDSPARTRIVQHFGDTFSWDFTAAGQPTFFFIDGSHSYDYTKNDSEKCYALAGAHSTILWHDADENHMGVVRLLQEWRALGRDVRLIAGTPLAILNNSFGS